jgi:drug/metabolite transporter (DMT)-like permease
MSSPVRDPDGMAFGLEALEAPGGECAEPAGDARPAGARGAAVGVLYVAVSAVCFGCMPMLGRLAYASGVDTATLLLLRFSIAAALMWIVFAARGAAVPRGKGLGMLIGMGAIGYAGQAFSYFTALSLASAGLAALLLYLYPAIVAVLSRIVFRHPLSVVQVLAIGMALLGSVLTIGRAGDGTPLGICFGLLAALIYAVYILTGGRLPADVTPTASATVVISSAAVVFAGVALVRGVRLPGTAVGWLAVIAIAVICTVVAISLFLAGLERLGPVRTSVYSTLEPATTLVLAAALLGEGVTPLRAAGGTLILGAVVLLARAEAGDVRPDARAHPAPR